MSLSNAERLWLTATVGFGIAFVFFIGLLAVDARQFNGEPVWAKPTKFAVSLALHYGTFAAVLHLLGAGWRSASWLEGLAVASVLAGVFELVYIGIQAGRMLPSHFNVSTPFYAAMYSLMAIGAVVILLPAVPLGIAAAADPAAALSRPMRLAWSIGLVGGTVLTLIVAFRLGGNGGHLVGAAAENTRAMLLTGWSLSIGDLRPAHFFALHLMQAAPLAGLALGRALPDRAASLGVIAFAGVWTSLCVLAFVRALSGRPLPWP